MFEQKTLRNVTTMINKCFINDFYSLHGTLFVVVVAVAYFDPAVMMLLLQILFSFFLLSDLIQKESVKWR